MVAEQGLRAGCDRGLAVIARFSSADCCRPLLAPGLVDSVLAIVVVGGTGGTRIDTWPACAP